MVSILLEKRYMLKLMIQYEISADYRNVEFSDPKFHFSEVKRVTVPPEGDSEGAVAVFFSQINPIWDPRNRNS